MCLTQKRTRTGRRRGRLFNGEGPIAPLLNNPQALGGARLSLPFVHVQAGVPIHPEQEVEETL